MTNVIHLWNSQAVVESNLNYHSIWMTSPKECRVRWGGNDSCEKKENVLHDNINQRKRQTRNDKLDLEVVRELILSRNV